MDPLRPIVDWITSLELGHPTRVGVDSRSAAGKTTLADQLAEVVPASTNRPVLRALDRRFSSPRPQIPFHARGVDAAILLRRRVRLPRGSGANLVHSVARQGAGESRKRFQAVQMS